MNLFRKAGATFEAKKRALIGGGEETVVCEACEERMPADVEFCPQCGAGVEEGESAGI